MTLKTNYDMEVQDVLKNALDLGACNQVNKVTDWKSLIWLFFSTQGREFCKNNNYPTLEIFRALKRKIEEFNLFVEEQDIKVINKDAAVINGTAELTYNGTDKAYKVILMHGADVTIRLQNYAVVQVENISGNYKLENDGTGRILV